MDVVERVIYDDAKFWSEVCLNPEAAYPLTMAAIRAMEPSLAAQYMVFLVKGIQLGHAEYKKLYAYQVQPWFLINHIFCRGKSGSAARAIMAVMSERLDAFKDQGFLTPLAERVDDCFYVNLLRSAEAKDEVVAFCLHWGLDEPSVLPDLVALTKNLAGSREGDVETCEFVHGRKHVALFQLVSCTIGPLATTCVIVELLFSQMKNTQRANETSESTDDELKFIFNVLRDGRQHRRDLLAHTKGGSERHLHTKEQIMMMCTQALALLPRYSLEAMNGIGGRRTFIGALKAADKITAERGAAVKNAKKTARSRANDRTTAEWDDAQAVSTALPLSVQRDQASMLAITQRQRIFAVAMEEKILSQVNNEGTFWSKLKGGVDGVKREVKMLLPLVGSTLAKLVDGTNRDRLANKPVTMVLSRGPFRVLRDSQWIIVPGLRNKELKVHANAQAQHGLLSVVASLRRAFFSRENPWKHGTGAVEGQVTVRGGAIQRGFSCPYCLRDGRKLQHWGCVACFLDERSRKAIGACVLMNTLTRSLLRQKSETAKTAAAREGCEWAE
jgi:hypothetical protein